MILDKRMLSFAAALSVALAACSQHSAGTPVQVPSGLVVVASTSTLASLVKSVAGDGVSVQTLVPVGVSPETYEPTPQDAIALSHATLVFENGAGLESWLDKLVTSTATHAKIIVLSDGVIGHQSLAQAQTTNPHLWLDPTYAAIYVDEIAQALASADPQRAALYRSNASQQRAQLAALDRWTKNRINTIPPAQRAMIAFHDAWYYFDKRYGIRDVGVIESSPGKEPSAQELAALISLAKANHVRAVFAEPEFSPKLAKELAEDAGIKTVTNLYDDSLGTTPQLGTYFGMMHHNVDTIVGALNS
jgi:zinc/manganese transport system substrate-binding protein